MIKLLWRWLVLAWALTPGALVAAEPRVIASIKPLALIAAEITDNVESLLPATASHHEFALRASHMRRLDDADLVLWVGPELEAFLTAALRDKSSSQVLRLDSLPGLAWPSADRADSHHHHHGRDPHLWLNPHNAVVVARALGEQLAQLDPANAEHYRRRAHQFAGEMQVLDREVQRQLAPLKGRGFAVYHDAYNHFVTRYGLWQIDYITLTPDQRPGARHIHQLGEALEDAVCLFTEPGAEDDATVAALAQRLQLPLAQVDPLGSDVDIERYHQLVTSMADAFSACLGQGQF